MASAIIDKGTGRAHWEKARKTSRASVITRMPAASVRARGVKTVSLRKKSIAVLKREALHAKGKHLCDVIKELEGRACGESAIAARAEKVLNELFEKGNAGQKKLAGKALSRVKCVHDSHAHPRVGSVNAPRARAHAAHVRPVARAGNIAVAPANVLGSLTPSAGSVAASFAQPAEAKKPKWKIFAAVCVLAAFAAAIIAGIAALRPSGDKIVWPSGKLVQGVHPFAICDDSKTPKECTPVCPFDVRSTNAEPYSLSVRAPPASQAGCMDATSLIVGPVPAAGSCESADAGKAKDVLDSHVNGLKGILTKYSHVLGASFTFDILSPGPGEKISHITPVDSVFFYFDYSPRLVLDSDYFLPRGAPREAYARELEIRDEIIRYFYDNVRFDIPNGCIATYSFTLRNELLGMGNTSGSVTCIAPSSKDSPAARQEYKRVLAKKVEALRLFLLRFPEISGVEASLQLNTFDAPSSEGTSDGSSGKSKVRGLNYTNLVFTTSNGLRIPVFSNGASVVSKDMAPLLSQESWRALREINNRIIDVFFQARLPLSGCTVDYSFTLGGVKQ